VKRATRFDMFYGCENLEDFLYTSRVYPLYVQISKYHVNWSV